MEGATEQQGLHRMHSLASGDGFFEGLLRVAVPEVGDDAHENEHVKLQAAIQFKNFLKEAPEALPSTALVPYICASGDATNKVLLAALKDKIKNHPTDDKLIELLAETIEQDTAGAMAIIRKVASVYKHSTSEAPMEKLMQAVFPKMERVMEHGLTHFAKEMEHTLASGFKTFAHATFGSVAWYLRWQKGSRYTLWLKYHENMLTRDDLGHGPAAIAAMRSLCQQV